MTTSVSITLKDWTRAEEAIKIAFRLIDLLWYVVLIPSVLDCHGNVWEWCQNSYQKDYSNAAVEGSLIKNLSQYKVLRGEAWDSCPWGCRSAERYRDEIDSRYGTYGFRVVLSPGSS